MKVGLVASACVLLGVFAVPESVAAQASRSYKPIYVDEPESAPAPASTPAPARQTPEPIRSSAQTYTPAPAPAPVPVRQAPEPVRPTVPIYTPAPRAPEPVRAPAPVYMPAPPPAPIPPPAPVRTHAPAPLAGGPVAEPPPARVVSSSNVIQGTAFLRTRNGQTRSCAGGPVRLFPRGPSTVAFVRQAYGAETGGFARRTIWEPQPFDQVVTVLTCDAQGGFAFDRLPDGDYYVAAVVSIESPAGNGGGYMVQEGGTIVSLVSVSGGAVKPIVLTR